MGNPNEIKLLAEDIASGLRKLGPKRAVALSVHVTKELIADLVTKANQLVDQLDSSGQ